MLARLLLLFVAIPLLELAILVKLGTVVGFWPTIGLVLVTGALGSWLARSQGGRVLKEIRAELRAGRMPAAHLLDGLMILIGGVLLLTPGVLSDLCGLTLLFPPTRGWFKRILRRRLERMIASGRVNFMMVVR
ncbi:MAG TPA: FxsA family protein [Longimicrobiales bacterium]